MLFLPLLVLCGVALGAVPPALDKPFYPEHIHEQLFEEFKTKYNKQYETPDKEKQRFEIFKKNLLRINELNDKFKETVYAMNHFSDLTTEEFTDQHTGWKRNKIRKPVPPPEIDLSSVEVPDAFDWRDKGVVARVKDQGGCGSCWAFGTIGSLESSYAIKHNNKIVEFSEQQLVACDDNDGKCNGGDIITACSYIQSKGEMTETDYPYEGVNGTCHYKPEKVKTYAKSCQDFAGTSEENIKKVLYTKGPLAVGIASAFIQPYRGGIFTDCVARDIDHAVLLVGYGKENGTPYWLIKNSWTTHFGEEGYIRIKRGVNCIGFGLQGSEVVAVEAK